MVGIVKSTLHLNYQTMSWTTCMYSRIPLEYSLSILFSLDTWGPEMRTPPLIRIVPKRGSTVLQLQSVPWLRSSSIHVYTHIPVGRIPYMPGLDCKSHEEQPYGLWSDWGKLMWSFAHLWQLSLLLCKCLCVLRLGWRASSYNGWGPWGPWISYSNYNHCGFALTSKQNYF